MNRMLTGRVAIVMLILSLTCLPAPAAGAGDPRAAISVMTRNLYLGAELGPILAAQTPIQLIEASTFAWSNVLATDFRERAEALADEIARSNPHLVGLQEVVLYRSQAPADLARMPNATHVEIDFLQILLDALNARGRSYAPVASVTDFDSEVPIVDPNSPTGLRDTRLTDHDVLLARTDLPAHLFSVSNAQAGNFETNIVAPILGGALEILRGWTAVDATFRGRKVRVVNAHLERIVGSIQEVQGAELLAGPLNTGLPVILVGDLNSAAGGVGAVPGQSDTATYGNIRSAGFRDVWQATWPHATGFTCCQAADLRNSQSTLTERIDFVLMRGPFLPLLALRFGEESADRTSSGLWPSDHAGLWALVAMS